MVVREKTFIVVLLALLIYPEDNLGESTNLLIIFLFINSMYIFYKTHMSCDSNLTLAKVSDWHSFRIIPEFLSEPNSVIPI